MNEREDMPSYGQNLRAILLILLVNVALIWLIGFYESKGSTIDGQLPFSLLERYKDLLQLPVDCTSMPRVAQGLPSPISCSPGGSGLSVLTPTTGHGLRIGCAVVHHCLLFFRHWHNCAINKMGMLTAASCAFSLAFFATLLAIGKCAHVLSRLRNRCQEPRMAEVIKMYASNARGYKRNT